MRMWMCNPKYMCNQHLRGEHVELHMLVGHLKKGRYIHGYIENNCLEPMSVITRHIDIAHEMVKRGMNHKSSLLDFKIKHLTKKEFYYKIDRKAAAKELFARCEKCRERRDRG